MVDQYSIKLFMWKWQHTFRIYAELSAKNIFNLLDKNLNPKIFLVGFLSEDKEDLNDICIEPEDGKYCPGHFGETIELAEGLKKSDKRSRMFVSGPDFVQKDYRDRIEGDALKKATETTLNEWENKKISFCSFPVLVEGYSVLVLLQLERDVFESHYSLTQKEIKNTPVYTSLLDATVQEFLEECRRKLSNPNPGKGNSFNRNPHEIIRAAGRNLMYTPAWAGNNLNGLGGLFDSCNIISSLRYEGEENFGNMIIAKQYDSQINKIKKYHNNIKVIIELCSEENINDYRAVRKLLEISSKDISILCDSYEIYGFGNILGDYNSNKEDLFKINFTKHYHWELLHDDRILMKVSYGQPNLPKKKLDEDKFKGDLKRIFEDKINEKQIEKLWNLVIEAMKQKHGTMVVITDNAEKESERLKNQCTKIDPLELTPELMSVVTPIDGSVLINQDSICFAIGVILDGLASENGTRSRGARYNSAIRYIEYLNSPCMAVVISEDGMIDLVPNLMPQISHSKLEEMIEKLRTMCTERDYKNFHKTIHWFDDNRFYLNSDICMEINEIKKKIENELTKKGNAHMVYGDFKPNDTIDSSYFIE